MSHYQNVLSSRQKLFMKCLRRASILGGCSKHVPGSSKASVSCRLKKVVVSCVLLTQGLVLSGRPTATLGTDVSRLPAQGCGTAFQLVLGKRTSAAKDLFVWALSSRHIDIVLNCASHFFN